MKQGTRPSALQTENMSLSVFAPWLLIAVAALLPNLPYLWAYFFMDDFWHVSGVLQGDYIFSSWLTGRESIDRAWYLSREVFPHMAWVEQMQFYFRPFFLISIWVDTLLFRFFAGGYHLHNILWHLAACFLLYSLMARLGLSRSVRLFCALIFAVHPVSVEPVGWISARCDLQVTTLCLASAITYYRFRDGMGFRYWGLHILLYAFALGSKEHAVAFALVLCCTEFSHWFFSKNRARTSFPIASLPMLLLAMLYFFWRLHETGGAGTWSMSEANFHTFRNYGPPGVVGYNILQYGKLLFFGLQPSSFSIKIVQVMTAPYLVTAALAVIVLPLWLFIWRRHRLLLGYFWAFGMLFAMIWMPATGRYLYPALPGFIILAGAFIERSMNSGKLRTMIIKVGIATVILLYATATLAYCLGGLSSNQATQRAVVAAKLALSRHPEAEDIYLLHLPPSMVHLEYLLPRLTNRERVRVHPLTYRSSVHDPKANSLLSRLAGMVYEMDERYLSPHNIHTRQLTENSLVVSSRPVGFFSGPASFGWNLGKLDVGEKVYIQAHKMSVRFGPHSDLGGISRLIFGFERPLYDPKNLWMEWKDGELKTWNPATQQ